MPLHLLLCVAVTSSSPTPRTTVNFDYAWRFERGGLTPPSQDPLAPIPREALPGYDDGSWGVVDAPHDMGRTHELSCMRTGFTQPQVGSRVPPPPPPPPTCRVGNLAGGDIHAATMTTPQAVQWCKSEPKCGGWSSEQSYPKSCTASASSHAAVVRLDPPHPHSTLAGAAGEIADHASSCSRV